jgi:hypothetical protein
VCLNKFFSYTFLEITFFPAFNNKLPTAQSSGDFLNRNSYSSLA